MWGLVLFFILRNKIFTRVNKVYFLPALFTTFFRTVIRNKTAYRVKINAVLAIVWLVTDKLSALSYVQMQERDWKKSNYSQLTRAGRHAGAHALTLFLVFYAVVVNRRLDRRLLLCVKHRGIVNGVRARSTLHGNAVIQCMKNAVERNLTVRRRTKLLSFTFECSACLTHAQYQPVQLSISKHVNASHGSTGETRKYGEKVNNG